MHHEIFLQEIPMTFSPITKFISVQGSIESNNDIPLTIDISSNVTWINITQLAGLGDIRETPMRTYTQHITKDIDVRGYYYEGYFSLSPQLTLLDYSYILATEIKLPNKLHSVFGLARLYDKESDNFIMQLYREGKIISAVFSLVYYGQHQTLQIGSMVDGLFEYPEFAFYIPFLDIDDKWRISLKGIFFGNLGTDFIPNVDQSKNSYRISQPLYEINSNIQLSTTDKNIIVPIAFLEYMDKYYFKGKYCKIISKMLISVFQCDPQYEQELSTLEDIHFVVDGNVALSFNASEMYTKNKSGMIFFAMMSFKEKDMWIFGYYFMKKFHLTFCYLSNELIIFSLMNKSYVILDKTPRFSWESNKTVAWIKTSLIMVMMLLSIWICFLVYIHKKKS